MLRAGLVCLLLALVVSGESSWSSETREEKLETRESVEDPSDGRQKSSLKQLEMIQLQSISMGTIEMREIDMPKIEMSSIEMQKVIAKPIHVLKMHLVGTSVKVLQPHELRDR